MSSDFPRVALKIVPHSNGSFDLLLKPSSHEPVVTIAHLPASAYATVYAQAFAVSPLAFHLIEDAIDEGRINGHDAIDANLPGELSAFIAEMRT